MQQVQQVQQAQQAQPLASDPGTSGESTVSEGAGIQTWPMVGDNELVETAPDLMAKNYYVVLDCSGSMAEKGCSRGLPKLAVAKQSLAKFAGLVPADANLGLIVFQSNTITELIPLGRDNREQFSQAVNQTRSSGGTPLFSAIRAGYIQVETQGKKQLGYGEYTLVIVTDGEANAGQDPMEIVQWILANTPVQIHTIGFCIGTHHSLNIPGRTIYKAADSPEQLEKGLQDVLAESETFDISTFN
ncbi:MAG: vWA domain-containing protein [Pseudomonadota bacterium]